jgi:hypothetical protein
MTVNDTDEVKTVQAIVPVEDNSNSDPYDGDTEDTVEIQKDTLGISREHQVVASDQPVCTVFQN